MAWSSLKCWIYIHLFVSTTLLKRSRGNLSQKGWHSHPKVKKAKLLKNKKGGFFFFFTGMGFCSIDCFTFSFFLVEITDEIKDFHYNLNTHYLHISLPWTYSCSVSRKGSHACFSLQKERHRISLLFSLKRKGGNLGRESVGGKAKKE